MKRITSLVLSLLVAFHAHAADSACAIPEWVTPPELDDDTRGDGHQHITMAPLVRFSLQRHLPIITGAPSGTLALVDAQPAQASLVMAWEDAEVAALHGYDSAYALFLDAFTGMSDAACRYRTEGLRLDTQTHLFRVALDEHATVFAFGANERHQFFILDEGHTDFVLTGLLRGMDTESLIRTLSSMSPYKD